MKPTTQRIIRNARLNRRRLCRGRRHTKAAAIMAIKARAKPRELLRAIYLGAASPSVNWDEPFEVI